jgi:hypothetical protein
MTVNQLMGPVVRPLAYFLEKNDMNLLGLRTTMRWAHRFNRLSYGSAQRARQRLYRENFEELLVENGNLEHPPIEMTDGWAIDRSQTLPHLAQLLQDAARIIAERGEQPTDDFGKPFLRSIMTDEQMARFPSVLNFATSSQLIATVAREAGFIPVMGNSMPPGVRLMESTTKFDPTPNGPWRSSQLWHLDYHSTPTIYVIVALRDITPDMGPLVFLSRSDSERAAAALKYRTRGSVYRVSDEAMRQALPDVTPMQFTGPAGSVLFIDSNRCFHYGSRCPKTPRYHMQYAYLSCCRNDFGDISRPQINYPCGNGDSRLRKLVLQRTHPC